MSGGTKIVVLVLALVVVLVWITLWLGSQGSVF
jgi:hypothetical protein